MGLNHDDKPLMPQGLPVDSTGGPTLDPTANVNALVIASNARQDDLRAYSERLTEAKLQSIEKLLDVRSQFAKEISELRACHAREMRIGEADRLDSIRQVDIGAVQTEAKRNLEAIQTLALQTKQDAQNVRDAVANAASTIAQQNTDTNKQIGDRIAALERSNYEGVGKQRLADPMMTELLGEVKILRESRSQSSGKSEGISASWALVLSAGGFILTVLTIAAAALALFSR